MHWPQGEKTIQSIIGQQTTTRMHKVDKRIGVVLILFEMVMIICYGCLTVYGPPATLPEDELKYSNVYPMFQDIQVMILVGFGMLMTFLKKYGYSGVAYNFLISAITFQYAIILNIIPIPGSEPKTIGAIDVRSLVNADVLTAAVLISLGAVLGKVSPLQIFFMIIIETPLFIANKVLSDHLSVVDIGGSVGVHTFGTYFGLGMSAVLGPPKNTELEQSSYKSNLFSVIGTLFLWAFWPSFNAVLSHAGDEKDRVIINTYLALLSSCVVGFAFSSLTHRNYKLSMGHIQNATLAGGVAIGTAANLKILPGTALLVGAIAGAMTVLGFVYIQPWLLKRFHLHDSCGVNNLHGLPSILAGAVGAIAASRASEQVYGSSEFKDLFPAMATGDSKRTGDIQAAFQILALVLTFLIAIAGGVATGLFIKLGAPLLGSVPDEYCFDDNLIFDGVEDDESFIQRRTPTLETVAESVRSS